MNWNSYKNWLLENVLHKEREHEEYIIIPEGQEKFSLTGSLELEKALNEFLASVDRHEGDLTYRRLPEWEEGRTWKELFMTREMSFGSRGNEISLSQQTWEDLNKLYTYWGTEKGREEKLKKEGRRLSRQLQQEKHEALMVLITQLSNGEELTFLYDEWLKNYELLGKESQKNIEEQKEKIWEDYKNIIRGRERQEELKQKFIQIIVEKRGWWKFKTFLISFFTTIIAFIVYYVLRG